jgi:hypothetical protein
VENNLMTTLQQAELQGKVFKLAEEFRHRHGLSYRSLFSFFVSFAWGYARREVGSSNEAIQNSMRALCETNELAYQRALSPRLPFGGGHS